ncbi:MAG TPA: hypothetical protein VFG21_09630 [Xanthomonadaceae bacterium]|nr:hypothetical protein [Xanthomonadaceae bacterium]
MDAMLTTPAWILLALAAVFALVALSQGFACRRRLRRRRRAAAAVRGLWALLALVLALVLGGLGGGLIGYARLLQDSEVAQIAVRQVEPQRWSVRVTRPDGWHRSYVLAGDQWQLDARVVRWDLPGALAGLPALYRVERISGRYTDAQLEREAERTVHELGGRAFPDLWTLKRQFPEWLPFVDADYGSAAYLPLIDGARYEVVLAPRGGLVARPADEPTQRLLDEAGW